MSASIDNETPNTLEVEENTGGSTISSAAGYFVTFKSPKDNLMK